MTHQKMQHQGNMHKQTKKACKRVCSKTKQREAHKHYRHSAAKQTHQRTSQSNFLNFLKQKILEISTNEIGGFREEMASPRPTP